MLSIDLRSIVEITIGYVLLSIFRKTGQVKVDNHEVFVKCILFLEKFGSDKDFDFTSSLFQKSLIPLFLIYVGVHHCAVKLMLLLQHFCQL